MENLTITKDPDDHTGHGDVLGVLRALKRMKDEARDEPDITIKTIYDRNRKKCLEEGRVKNVTEEGQLFLQYDNKKPSSSPSRYSNQKMSTNSVSSQMQQSPPVEYPSLSQMVAEIDNIIESGVAEALKAALNSYNNLWFL